MPKKCRQPRYLGPRRGGFRPRVRRLLPGSDHPSLVLLLRLYYYYSGRPVLRNVSLVSRLDVFFSDLDLL